MIYNIDAAIGLFNTDLPPNAPGCDDCSGGIRALRDHIEGADRVVIDIVRTDIGCPTLNRCVGVKPFTGDVRDTFVVRHRINDVA